MGDFMKRVFFLFLFTTIIFAQTGAKLFERVSNIPVPLKEHDGWGNFVTGFDLDNNGKIDLIAINHNAIDTDTEYVGSMIPSIYRYEYDAQSKTWSEIWNTTLANIPLQNTWPQLLAEDIDGDGKLEIIWSVVNYPSSKYNPNPDKIFIFKVNTDGTLGISDGLGGYTPNTATKVFDDSTSIYYNTRPYRMFVKDIDNDGKKANYDLNSDLKLVIKFFKEYYSEVIEHFDYENNIVFPYINFLLEKSENYNLSSNIHYSMEEYKNHHDDINEKLLDLKNLLIKYLPSTFDSVLRKKLLFNLYQLEKDLAIHSYIEDKILIPIVEMLENECK